MGDSLLAWNGGRGQSIPDEVERLTGRPVIDRSVIGTRILPAWTPAGLVHGTIGAQYLPGNWEWILLNGGGNDLWWGCGCTRCAARIDELISQDGRDGAVPALVARLRATGARVVWIGYLPLPGRKSPVDFCDAIGREYEARIARMAARDNGVFMLSNRDLVPARDLGYHALDRVHPSPRGSAAIAARVARILREAEGRAHVAAWRADRSVP